MYPNILFIEGIEIHVSKFIENPLKYDSYKILSKFPELLNNIDKSKIPDDIYYALIENNNINIVGLPEHLKTHEICKRIIITNCSVLSNKIPEEFEIYLTHNI